MKSKLLKSVTFFVALIMVAGIFGGCSKSKKTDIATGAPLTLNGDKIYPIQCEDTLTFWFSGDTIWQQQYENFGDTPLGKALNEKTGVKIEYIHPTQGQSEEQFQILLASDELPDIVNNFWHTFPGGPDAAIEQEYIYKLNDIVEEYCPALTALLKDHPDWEKEVKSDSSALYAFPGFNNGGRTLATYGPVIRADWLRDLELEKPNTIEEWETVLAAFKEKKGAEIPYAGDPVMLSRTFMPAFSTYTEWYRDGDTVKYGQAQPQYKDFLKKMNEWYNKGLIDPDFAVYDGNKNQARMLNGQAGATNAWGGSQLGTWLTINKDVEGYDLTGTTFTMPTDGEKAEYSYYGAEASGSNCKVAISKNCKNVELAARFLDYGYTEEGHYLYNFGVEGETFNFVDKNGEKYPQFSELVTNNPDGLTMATVISMYCRSGHMNVPMVADTHYIEQYYQIPQQGEAQTEWMKTNMAEHLLPTIYIAQEDSDRDSDIMAAVKTYVDEMTIKFISGREPIENFDKYLEQLKNLGLDEAIAHRQAAYERYKSR